MFPSNGFLKQQLNLAIMSTKKNKEPTSLEDHLKIAHDLEQGMMRVYICGYTNNRFNTISNIPLG